MLLRARNCTIPPAGHGLPLATSTTHAFMTQRHCCPTAWSLLQGDVMAPVSTLPTPSLARNCTILRAGPGISPAASTTDVLLTRPACCPTAWSLLQRE